MIPRQRHGIVVTEATAEDIDEIVSLGTRLFAESCFRDLTIDVEGGRAHLAGMVDSPAHGLLVARLEETGMAVGFMSFMVVRTYSVEGIAYLDLLYALPEYRMTAAGRDLVTAAVSLAKDKGAAMFFAGLGSGFADDGKSDRRLLNLLKKIGFSKAGPSVRKVLND